MGVPMRVMVVDDDRRMVRTICDILLAKGFGAVPVMSGEAAVELVKTDRPDCVLMDVRMPGIGGVEALKMMREFAPDLPVVLMSAYATGEQADEAKAMGAYSILTKPIDIQQVLSFLSLLKREKSVLVVDDDPAFCETLRNLLQSRQYRVETENDSERALHIMEQKYELVVLLDLKLGGADGLETLRDIRSRYPTKPVVLITSHSENMGSTIEKGLQIGAYTCLYKPLITEELIRLIEEISRKKLRAFLGEPFFAAEGDTWTNRAS